VPAVGHRHDNADRGEIEPKDPPDDHDAADDERDPEQAQLCVAESVGRVLVAG
jgi:hypothetical protein